MQGETSGPGAPELLRALKEAGDDRVRIVAVLWTWLEQHKIHLGSMRETPDAIIRAAREKPPFTGVTDGLLDWIREKPQRNAAELLAVIGYEMLQVKTPMLTESVGFDGAEVIVAWRKSELVRIISGDEYPPSAIEHPSLTAFARSLIVCPRKVQKIEMKIVSPSGKTWEAAKQRLDKGLGREGKSTLTVHLDTLGEHGLSGLAPDEDNAEFCCYDEDAIDPDDEARCAEAARAAVRKASGEPSVLLMPELTATTHVLEAIREELRAAHPAAPALTVVGLYHRDVAGCGTQQSPVAGEEDLAPRVNEAVVLGPDGEELWRHRKLTRAQGEDPESGRVLFEGIRLGSEIGIVRTPLGIVAVPICLDAFAGHSRERLANSPANVLFVPSLSPTVHRHCDSLQHLVQALWGIAFVCNRSPYSEPGGAGVWNADSNRSFWVIQRDAPRIQDAKNVGEHPSFVFRLEEEKQRKEREKRRRRRQRRRRRGDS